MGIYIVKCRVLKLNQKTVYWGPEVSFDSICRKFWCYWPIYIFQIMNKAWELPSLPFNLAFWLSFTKGPGFFFFLKKKKRLLFFFFHHSYLAVRSSRHALLELMQKQIISWMNSKRQNIVYLPWPSLYNLWYRVIWFLFAWMFSFLHTCPIGDWWI